MLLRTERQTEKQNMCGSPKMLSANSDVSK